MCAVSKNTSENDSVEAPTATAVSRKIFTPEVIESMEKCSPLLGKLEGEVVRSCLGEIKRLRGLIERAVKSLGPAEDDFTLACVDILEKALKG